MCGGSRTHLQVCNELVQQVLLVRHIEDREWAGVLGLWRVLEVLYVGRHDLPVHYQEPLSVDHVGDHKDAVHIGVWEFQRRLFALDVEGKDPGNSTKIAGTKKRKISQDNAPVSVSPRTIIGECEVRR